jgi:hypothetical protein
VSNTTNSGPVNIVVPTGRFPINPADPLARILKDQKRWRVLQDNARAAADRVRNGQQSRIDAIDTTYDFAVARGFVQDDGGEDTVQAVLDAVFEDVVEPDKVPDDDGNGFDRDSWEEKCDKADEARARSSGQMHAKLIVATPFVWREPATIPPRKWLYSKHYIRTFLSCTIAPGGLGKTSLAIVEALAMASHRALLGIMPAERARVWIWNGEDPLDELDRRITAAMVHHNVKPEEITGYLFRNTGRDTPIILATQTRNNVTIAVPVVDAVIENIKRNHIDVLMIDPFVKSHRVNENDNTAIDMVATQWAEIADYTGCCIGLLQHPRKTGGGEVTVDDSRGASALINASRAARVLNRMTKPEATNAGVAEKTAWRYFRVEDGKASMAPMTENADWYRLEPVSLANGDNIGVAATWTWPSPFDGITVHDLRLAQKAVSEGGPWRVNHRASAWVGKPIAKALKLDLAKASDRAKVRGMLAKWIETEMFVVVEGKGDDRHPTQFVEVGKWAND